jgi:alcohol dehydrogenase class IV
MVFSLISSTKVVRLDALRADDLSRAAAFLTGKSEARILAVKDPRPFPALDTALAGFLAGRPSLVLDRVVPNPQTADIMAMVDAAREFSPDLVVGIGGGSALDSAKAVRALAAHEGDLDDYLGPQATRKLEKAGPKLLLIPTTTGTGAEVTKFGVYTARSGRKYSLANPLLQADAALLASSLVADIPASLLASTAYDAITHALEPLWNKNATALSDAVASDALASLLALFRPAYEARVAGRSDRVADLQAAACAAGAAFNLTGTAAIHALSFILSEEWHVPHGAACAFFAEDVFDHNLRDAGVRAKLAAVARAAFGAELAGVDEASALARLRAELVGLKRLTSLPSRFADIGADLPALTDARVAELFDKTQDDFKMKNNVPPMDAAAVRALVGAKRR